MIADDTVDAVYVATPPDSHEDYTLKALAAGSLANLMSAALASLFLPF